MQNELRLVLSGSAVQTTSTGLTRMLSHFAVFSLLFSRIIANYTCDGKAELDSGVTYHGVHKDGVEAFIGIKYGQDTSGPNRFEAPKPYTPTADDILANHPGPACPQDAGVGESFLPLYLTIPEETSEDCLSLNVNRPNGTARHDNLPVMVFIHGVFKRVNLTMGKC